MNNTINKNMVTGIPGALAANETGGGISNAAGASFSLVNSIVAQNSAPTNADVDGVFTDLGHNFIGDGTGSYFTNGSNGDQVGTTANPLDPQLGPLQDNGGGGILTELPLAGSPVIDAGDNSQVTQLTDERGYVRIINNVVDLGAVEYNSFLPADSIFVTSSTNPAIPGQPITFTATVMSPGMPGSAPIPTGSVTFMDGQNVLGTGTLAVVNGQNQATFTTSTLALGVHDITALYGGDNLYPGSSASLTQTVSKGFSSLALVSHFNPDQSLTFTADILAAGGMGAPAPTGSVTFYNGTSVLGSGGISQVNGMYQASLTTTLGNGSYAITAIYSGDNSFEGAGGTMTQNVGQTSLVGSSTWLSSSAITSQPGQAITLTATVSGGSSSPSGSVTFMDGTTVLGTETLSVVNGQAQASLNTSALALGTHDITAIYSGDGIYAGSGAMLQQTVSLVATSTSVSSSASPAFLGDDVTFTATVAVSGMGSGSPTGTVTFMDGTTVLGSGTLSLVNEQYQATFTTAALGLGTHTILAVYSGDSTFADSGSSLQQTIN